MEDQHLTQQNFAQMIGISTATLSNIFNGKTNPSLSIVDGIHKSFPQVNVYGYSTVLLLCIRTRLPRVAAKRVLQTCIRALRMEQPVVLRG